MKTWKSKRGVYLIAEVGGNHEGDFEKAIELAELACKSGADAVKFQIYSADSLVSKMEEPKRHAHFKKLELLPEQHIALAEICRDNGVTYTASVWDMNALEWIDPYMKFYKIGSGDLTAYPILEKIARIGKPIIVSTGLATLEEIKGTVQFLQSINDRYKQRDYLALLQCTTSYPNIESEVNLRVMKTLKKEFSLTVGYSDHTRDSYAAQIAVAMGAEILELHFTDNKLRENFRDHQISFTNDDIQKLVCDLERIKTLEGSLIKKPTEGEIKSGHIKSFRRGVYALRDITKEEIIDEYNSGLLRPKQDLDLDAYKDWKGKKLNRSVKKFHRIDQSFLY